MMLPYVVDNDFAEWAFGETWFDYLVFEAGTIDLVDAWNERHGNFLKVKYEDSILVSIARMKALWRGFNARENYKPKGNQMDKKMSKVTKAMKTAEKDVKKGKAKAAVKVLKKAEKKNVKLTKIDREVRDPLIKKAKKIVKKAKIVKKTVKAAKKPMKKGKC